MAGGVVRSFLFVPRTRDDGNGDTLRAGEEGGGVDGEVGGGRGREKGGREGRISFERFVREVNEKQTTTAPPPCSLFFVLTAPPTP